MGVVTRGVQVTQILKGNFENDGSNLEYIVWVSEQFTAAEHENIG